MNIFGEGLGEQQKCGSLNTDFPAELELISKFVYLFLPLCIRTGMLLSGTLDLTHQLRRNAGRSRCKQLHSCLFVSVIPFRRPG